MGYLRGNAIYQYSAKNELQTVDAIVVLDVGVSGGEPSSVFHARIDHGIWLSDNGYGKKLILTGGKRPGCSEADSEVAKSVFSQDILIEIKSRSTEKNIVCAQQLARQAGLNSLMIPCR
jgi:uncharacterized SAM-binding protein YcdF (DUF218 family)